MSDFFVLWCYNRTILCVRTVISVGCWRNVWTYGEMNNLMWSFRKLFAVIGLFVIPTDAYYLEILKTNTWLRCLQGWCWGNMRIAVHWLMEHSGGGVLKPSDSTTIGGTSMTILDAKINFPLFEDSEITWSLILSTAHQLQGGAGPSGCDASHWRDILLRYGFSSTHLHDSVTGLCRCLCNSIVPWNSIRALVASCLIALDKCLGVKPIGIAYLHDYVTRKSTSPFMVSRKLFCHGNVLKTATVTCLQRPCG